MLAISTNFETPADVAFKRLRSRIEQDKGLADAVRVELLKDFDSDKPETLANLRAAVNPPKNETPKTKGA